MSSTAVASPAAGSTGFLRRRGIWLVLAVALLLAVGVALVSGGEEGYDDPLDPENFGAEGTRALAQVLAADGVEVHIVRSAAEFEDARVDADTTVVVTGSHRLAPSTTTRLLDHAEPSRLVLPDPSLDLLRAVTTEADRRRVEPDGLAADCTEYAGLELVVDEAVAWREGLDGCFTTQGRPILAEAGDAVLFGAAAALTNDQVLRGDNAAIALRLLGQHSRLVWYLPAWDDAAEDETAGLADLLPDWIVPGLWLGLAAGIALVFWRFRRLGPLSQEPLPVVVRAIETARSRGRMYHHSRDRDHAAAALRRAARRRAAERLQLGRRAEEATVLTAVAQHLGTDMDQVRALIGSDAESPATDEALVQLADALVHFESFDARRPDPPNDPPSTGTAAGRSESDADK